MLAIGKVAKTNELWTPQLNRLRLVSLNGAALQRPLWRCQRNLCQNLSVSNQDAQWPHRVEDFKKHEHKTQQLHHHQQLVWEFFPACFSMLEGELMPWVWWRSVINSGKEIEGRWSLEQSEEFRKKPLSVSSLYYLYLILACRYYNTLKNNVHCGKSQRFSNTQIL